MDHDALQVGEVVEILATTELPPGQPAPLRRLGRVLAGADDNGRVAVQVEGRQYPLLVPAPQLRRVVS
jgi:hypothetical protein